METIAIIIAGASLALSIYLLFVCQRMNTRLDVGGVISDTLDAIRKQGEAKQKEEYGENDNPKL